MESDSHPVETMPWDEGSSPPLCALAIASARVSVAHLARTHTSLFGTSFDFYNELKLFVSFRRYERG